jgi:aminoglycoside 6'-N-acetyltransferase I
VQHRADGQGWQALVAAAEQWALQQGCVEMASDARIENTVSQQAHLAIGFEETGRLVCFKRRLVVIPNDRQTK